MSIKARFKSSSYLVSNGVWKDLPVKNSDGTQPRFRIRRTGTSNRMWAAAFREHSKDVDVDALTPEQDAEMMAKTFIRACIADAENFQPEDDGNVIEGTYEALVPILTNPDWVDLLDWLRSQAGELTNFQETEKTKAEAKN